MSEKRYYWLKLQEDFFASKRIKKLRRIAGGDTYTIIYLKMQLLSIRDGGILKYSGLESSFAEELALDLDEDAENVAVTLQFLLSCGLIETSDNMEYLLPFAAENTGSEGSGAKRVREFRERQKALHCNGSVTQAKQIGNGEIEIDKEIELDIEKEIDNNAKSKPVKHKYGEYKNVLLTDDEMDKLSQEYPDYEDRIENLSNYLASTGKSYKSHYATIRNWARKESKPSKSKASQELDDFYRMANSWAERGEA